jgi:hypothetical protein
LCPAGTQGCVVVCVGRAAAQHRRR